MTDPALKTPPPLTKLQQIKKAMKENQEAIDRYSKIEPDIKPEPVPEPKPKSAYVKLRDAVQASLKSVFGKKKKKKPPISMPSGVKTKEDRAFVKDVLDNS